MKRKYIDRSDWKRIKIRKYKQKYFEEETFEGFVSCLKIEKVNAPLIKHMFGKEYCIVDDGYIWLQHLPKDKNYALTTMYDSNGDIIQWYFDIIKSSGIDRGRPYFDDLYLDVVLLSTGQVLLLDEDELMDALKSGDIDKNDYDVAYTVAESIIKYITDNFNKVVNFSNSYLEKMK